MGKIVEGVVGGISTLIYWKGFDGKITLPLEMIEAQPMDRKASEKEAEDKEIAMRGKQK